MIHAHIPSRRAIRPLMTVLLRALAITPPEISLLGDNRGHACTHLMQHGVVESLLREPYVVDGDDTDAAAGRWGAHRGGKAGAVGAAGRGFEDRLLATAAAAAAAAAAAETGECTPLRVCRGG